MKQKKRQEAKLYLKMKHCRYCLATENLTIDHKIPLIQGGTDDLKNLQVLCRRCNCIKGKHSHHEVRRLWRWFNQINALREKRGKEPYYLGKVIHN